jgi:hypothetical protein
LVWLQLAHPLRLLKAPLVQQRRLRPLPLQVVLQVVPVRGPLERLAPLGLQVRLPV